MNKNTIKFVPSSPDDAENIAEFLDELLNAKLQMTSPRSNYRAALLQRWTVTDDEVCVTFSPGVLEIVGEQAGLERDELERDGRKILKTLGMSEKVDE